MSFVAPNGTIYLIGNIPVNNAYEHVLRFPDAATQRSYFIGKTVYTMTNYSYVRKDGIIRVEKNYDDLFTVNYALYQNYTSGKWIYAFITDKTYINENVTALHIETDVMSTYMFDYTINPSFIEREHQDRWEWSGSAYAPIFNIQPEGLAYGDEYTLRQSWEIQETFNIKWYLITSTEKLGDVGGTDSDTTFPVQKVPTPFHYYLIPDMGGAYTIKDKDDRTLINAFIFSQHSGAASFASVISCVLIPYVPYNWTYTYNETPPYYKVSQGTAATSHIMTLGGVGFYILKLDGAYASDGLRNLYTWLRFYDFNFPTTFAPGIARDKKYESKLHTFPYSYLELADNQGEPAIYKYEYFSANSITVYIRQALSHQPKTRYWLKDYNFDTGGKKHGLLRNTVNELPTKTDAYEQYILQNKSQMISGLALNVVGTASGIAVSALSGGALAPLAVGGVVSSASQIASTLSKLEDIKRVPDSVKSSGNNIFFDVVDENINLTINEYYLPETWQQVIADYFHLFGYKCNQIKVPNLASRYYFNYIKMIGANITGNIDQNDLIKIKSIFNNGTTFWHARQPYIKVSSLITNGNFADGTTGWDGYHSTISIVSGNLRGTSTGTSTFPYLFKITAINTISSNDKIYIRLKARVNNDNATSMRFLFDEYYNGVYVRTLIDSLITSNPTQDQWYDIDNVYTLTSNIDFNHVRFRIVANYTNLSTSNGKTHEIKGGTDGVILINLTDTFGAGNEPNLAACQSLFPGYFTEKYISYGALTIPSVCDYTYENVENSLI